jgi:hypothetical protein
MPKVNTRETGENSTNLVTLPILHFKSFRRKKLKEMCLSNIEPTQNIQLDVDK